MIYDDVTYDPAKHLILFIHIRKNGGSTLLTRLSEVLPAPPPAQTARRLGMQGLESHDQGFLLMHEHARRRLIHWRQEIWHETRRMLGLSNASMDTVAMATGHVQLDSIRTGRRMPLMITTTRDPVDRMVSEYFFTRDKVVANPRPARAAKKISAWAMEFEPWAESLLEQADRLPLNGQCRYISPKGDFESARRIIDERFLLAAPLSQMQRFTELLGAKLNVGLTEGRRENAGRSRPARFEVPAQLRSRIESALAEDVALHAHVSREFTALAARHGV
jgi:hypothetical protein